MKRQLLSLFLILFFIVSCEQKEAKETKSVEQKSTVELEVEPEKQKEKTSIAVQYFENDSLRVYLNLI